MPRWAIIAATVVVGIIIAGVVPGVFGHVLALLVWAGAAWSCLRSARSRVKSTARTWARIGVVVFACAALYAGTLAIVGNGNGNSASSGSSLTCEGATDGVIITGLATCATVIVDASTGNFETWYEVTDPASLNLDSLTPVCTFHHGAIAVYDPNGTGDGSTTCTGMQANGAGAPDPAP